MTDKVISKIEPERIDPADGDNGALNGGFETAFEWSAGSNSVAFNPDFFKFDGVDGEYERFVKSTISNKALEPEKDDGDPGVPTERDPGDTDGNSGDDDASGQVSTEHLAVNFTEIRSSEASDTNELGESGYGPSASDDYHDDTSDVGRATFSDPLADDKTFEPPIDDSEPGPGRPDPAESGHEFQPNEVYLTYSLEAVHGDSDRFEFKRAEDGHAAGADEGAELLDLIPATETEQPGEIPLGWGVGGIESDGHTLDNDGAVIFFTDDIEAWL